MDPTNHFYGHSRILSRYCGLPPDDPPRIGGVLQHGWTFVHGYGIGHKLTSGYGKYVWSDVVRRRGIAHGWRDYTVIGAPWNYLLELEPEEPAPAREGTIFYPFHGWDRNELLGAHDRLIAEIRATEPGPVTMCLYWLEYDQPHIRTVYEKAGFRVISHGRRDGDPGFLYRQLAELRRHRRVASNRLTSAVFYGIAAGCAPAVYGDPMLMAGVNPLYEGRDLVPRLYPELHGPSVELAVAREIAAAELGRSYLAPPEELRLLLRWPVPAEVS
ncbi:hypothetical protein [Actinocorallia longicatena]|uniref:Polysaccharide pyruvyl transferase n=1 Tax=Actinocorallia longicatena TaxID=111803 RepID=A0ABP6QJW4_9ACTN